MISLHQFYYGGIVRSATNRERYGQAMFNHLVEIRPDLAEKIRGTNMDPFFCNRPNDPSGKFDRFVQFIEENWRK